ncbi:ABC transporter substrate-binding protein [Caenibius sp. WL]|uniref:ABC transporter substrate-binding protein n=1 Tax=Caenibius sp. WL TaxID=2872646 RepID=UPI001C99460D|nr:ABC transporter substrate-binding protein [Caenibius sp. WL]QZP06741.1 ABC transporter substrate-binding protein [Caenibius sp. WL]
MKQGAFLALACLAFAGWAMAGCAPAAAPGESSRGPMIVSLNPCSDAVLAEVADPAQILAISHYSHDPRASSMPPDQARRFRSTGGTVEEVIALKPDVVIAGAFLPPATRAAFGRLGIRVESFDIEHTVPESLARVRRIAAIAGHADRGEALVRRIGRALAAAAPPPGEPPLRTILWQSAGIVPGEDALVSDMLRRTGFASQSAARGLRQADYLPLEEVLIDPPHLILTAATPGDGEDRMLSHPALRALAGTRRAHFDAGLLYCGGPTLIRAADRLAAIRREAGA